MKDFFPSPVVSEYLLPSALWCCNCCDLGPLGKVDSFVLFLFLFFKASPAAYRSTQAKAESELQLSAYATATAVQVLSCICGLHHSSQQCQILQPLSKARDWTHIFIDTSQVRYFWAMMGTPGKVDSLWIVVFWGWVVWKYPFLEKDLFPSWNPGWKKSFLIVQKHECHDISCRDH